MTRKQKAVVIEEYIKLYSERSDNWIAEDLGVNDETVTAKRQGLEEAGQLTETVSLKGKDGRGSGGQIAHLESIGEFHQYLTAQTKDGREATVESPQLDKLQGKDELESGAKIPHLNTLTGKDGREATCEIHKLDKPERRRIEATYCPTCAGWVEVRLRPVRLHCTRCGLEARP